MITITRVGEKIGDKTFQRIANLSVAHSNFILKFIKEVGIPDCVMCEEPFNGSDFSSGLHALDATILYGLRLTKGIKEIYNMHPTYLTHVHGKGYSATDSVNLAQKMLSVFLQNGYTLKCKTKRICHDEAEGSILCFRLFVHKQLDNVIINELKSINPKIGSSKEKILFTRGEV